MEKSGPDTTGIVNPLSMTISSQWRRVCFMSAARHCWVNSSWFQHGMMIDARPATGFMVFMMLAH
jgi:hypothetical protein